MPGGALTTVAPAWAVVALLILGAFATAAAMLDGALTARANGAAGGAVRPFAEAARLMLQRRRLTVKADALLSRIGGAGLLVVAALMVTVVPLGRWTLFDLDGVVWFNAMDVMVWALVWLAGWGANSAHSLVGGYRFLALGLGYELPLMFALGVPHDRCRQPQCGGRAHPWLGGALVVALLGLVGTPPTAVFVGKLTVATAAWDGGIPWLAVVLFLNTLVSLFYYLRWIARVYGSGESVHASVFGAVTAARFSAATAIVAAVLTLILGIGAGLIWAALG